ncbi:hypothetical protein A3J19_00415 [Candidatus Daviesbacteria bacterium RIFCSPLOWO2_02_FULL_41_8]|uniref:Uncharacterized protein n=3 Tax=Candidatus Daviesiibacteriota TaxID=1752718 RepID=A0A1F5NH49_9BACT|nr:MAG: hypothetical protein A2871_02760 [Candidatus Daviesbacteria bacterium RIFCSPHIGHO2_01_FULL_41_23]OGE33831.1 MAG: hypothetical protein A3D83_04635 [Candidatus Daviesbacteria bacterium RIFCSPHIGHO2_02_FULL_41_10]OGE62098.1 MAG: hypothetical protein A2967_00375 [Candidatus Daviesbacteria bacterium RIFCSPLOWO2_01_FULL_41_32]OGE76864.1 MAG: hypothetical protein A3J19_00415 [Candidatus Daviesbacteria bacterium RIFCSPLOWO2_02_FULL_41_8]
MGSRNEHAVPIYTEAWPSKDEAKQTLSSDKTRFLQVMEQVTSVINSGASTLLACDRTPLELGVAVDTLGHKAPDFVIELKRKKLNRQGDTVISGIEITTSIKADNIFRRILFRANLPKMRDQGILDLRFAEAAINLSFALDSLIETNRNIQPPILKVGM